MKDLKKNTILNAATMIFAEKGYQYATIAEIAKEAGVKIVNFNGNDFKIGDKRVIASNNSLHERLFSILS